MKLYFHAFKSHPKVLSLIVALSILSTALEAVSLYGFIPLLFQDSLLNWESDHLLNRTIFTFAKLFPFQGQSLNIGSTLAFFILIKGLIQYCIELLHQRVTLRLEENYTKKIRSEIFRSSWKDFLQRPRGHYFNLINKELPDVVNAYFATCRTVSNFVVAFFFFCIGAMISPISALAVLLALFMLPVLKKIFSLSKELYQTALEERLKYTAQLNEDLNGFKFLLVSGLFQLRDNQFSNSLARAFSQFKKASFFEAFIRGAPQSLAILGVLIFYFFCSHIFSVPPATFSVFILFTYRSFSTLLSASQTHQTVVKFSPAFFHFIKFFERNVSGNLPSRDDKKRFHQLEQLELKEVSFRHDKNSGWILKDYSLAIKKNQITLLLGESGAGKTTLLDIISGVLSPKEGQVLINQLPLEDYNLESFYQKISYLTQEPFLIQGTIEENLRLYQPNAGLEEMRRACSQAMIDEYIMSCPLGYKSLVGEGGQTLSGGQKQRLALARAILRQPELILLDEPTSAVDDETKRVLFAALQKLKQETTILLVTHNKTCLDIADQVISVQPQQQSQHYSKSKNLLPDEFR